MTTPYIFAKCIMLVCREGSGAKDEQVLLHDCVNIAIYGCVHSAVHLCVCMRACMHACLIAKV